MEKPLFENMSGQTAKIVVVGLDDLEKWGKSLIEQAIKSVQKDDDKYLTPDEVSDLLKVTRSTLWRWAKSNYLTPRRIGRKPRYLLSDVQRLINDDVHLLRS